MKTETKKIKDMTIYTGDAVLLDFGSQVETIEEIEVGMTATIEGGGVPDGDYVMPTGAIWTFVKGKLTKKGEPTLDQKAGTQAKVSGLRLSGRLKIYATKKNRFAGISKLGV